MESIVDVVVTALPFLEGWVSAAQVVVTAIPAFLTDTAQVVVTALPQWGAIVVGLPTWLYGLIGGGFLTWTWCWCEGNV